MGRQWPSGCSDANSCLRHEDCMYRGCEHEADKSISDIIRYRKAVDAVNRMTDNGKTPTGART